MPVNSCGTAPASFDPDAYDPTASNLPDHTDSAGPPPMICGGPIEPTREDDASLARTEAVALYHSAEADSTTGALTVGVAVLKGHEARSGVDAEVFFAGAESGPSFQGAEVTMGRVGISGEPGWDYGFVERASASLEVFTAHAAIGVHNPDGSTGFGVSVGASAVGAEGSATLVDGLVSGSVGVSAGVTFEAAVGLRDRDADGRPELCGRLGFGLTTGDICLEWPF